MTINWLLIGCSVAVIGCAMSAGLLYTFSDFVMRSMNLAKTAAGVQFMQKINREIMRSGSIYLLWGTVVLSSALGVLAAFTTAASAAMPIAVGGLAVFVGFLHVTFRFNVSMNIHLKKLSYAEPSAANYWHVPTTGMYKCCAGIVGTGSVLRPQPTHQSRFLSPA